MEHRVKHGKIEVLPAITRGLTDLRCCDGDSVTFECLVSGTPEPSFKWDKDGRIIPTGTDFISTFDGEKATLTINEVFPEDEGEYTCVAYNDLGKVSTSACLIVDVPEEKANMLSQQLSRPPSFLSASSTPRSTPRSTPARSFSPVSHPDNRSTRGQPENTRGRGSRLKQSAPKFYAYPHSKVVEEGGSVRFQCAIAGHPTPWVTWDKDGIIVTPTARITIIEKDDIRILEIDEVTVEDAGLYRLTLDNDVGRVEATARLDVIALRGSSKSAVRAYSSSPRTSPSVNRHLIGSAARIGERIRLSAEISSGSNTSHKWYKNALPLDVDDPRIECYMKGSYVELTIENAELSDNGEYLLLACNTDGIASTFADVKVVTRELEETEAPSFTRQLTETINGNEGDDITLSCEVRSTKEYEIRWYKDGALVPDWDTFTYRDHGGGRIDLLLKDVFEDDSGTYVCRIINEFGEDSTSSVVNVKGLDERRTVSARMLKFTKEPLEVATFVGNAASFCTRAESTHGFEPKVTWSVGQQPIPEGHKLFHFERDEDAYILHIMRVERWMAGEIVCEASLDEDGQITKCRTTSRLTIVPSTAIFSYHPEEKERESTVPCLKPIEDVTVVRGDTITLKVYYDSQSPARVEWFRGAIEIKQEYSAPRPKYCISTLPNLSTLVVSRACDEDAGTYTVRVRDCCGTAEGAGTVRVEGVPDAPTGKPCVTSVSGEIIITWSSAPYDGCSAITAYRLEKLLVNVREPTWKIVTVLSNTLSYVIRDLHHNELYRFRVRAVNSRGVGPPSEETDPISLEDEENASGCEEEIDDSTVAFENFEVFHKMYEELGEIGRGNFGTVSLVKDTKGHRMAAKIIRTIQSIDKDTVRMEVDIMNQLKHCKLLQLVAAYESPTKMILVTEYISGGELFERVAADDFTLTEDDCITFMKQICEGVGYMHKQSIVHLDLKPENIMCRTRTSNQIKVIDFGLARKIDPKKPLRVSFGTRDFISPEIANFEPVNFEADMWSVGVICYVLLSGLLPFGGDTWSETLVNITLAEFDFDDESFDAVSEDAKEFISQLLQKLPKDRLTADQCLAHKWIAQHGDVSRTVKLNTEKLKRFIVKRKWHKSGNALRALNRLAQMTAHTRRESRQRDEDEAAAAESAAAALHKKNTLARSDKTNWIMEQ